MQMLKIIFSPQDAQAVDWLKGQISHCPCSSGCIVLPVFPCVLLEHCSLFLRICCSSERKPTGNEDRLGLAEAESFATPDSKAKLCSLP